MKKVILGNTARDIYLKVALDKEIIRAEGAEQDLDTKIDNINETITNINEKLEGKNKSIILYYSTSGLPYAPFPADDYYKEDGTQFTSWEEIDEYIGSFALAGGCGNPRFNSQDNYIDIYDKYLITSDHKIIVPHKGHLKVGDNIFVVETDVPDRWIGNQYGSSSTIGAFKLETTKVDLSNYVDLTTNQTITGPKALTGNLAVNTLDIGMPYGMGGNNSQPQNITITTIGQKLNFKAAIVGNHAGTSFDFGTNILSHVKNFGDSSYLKLPAKGTSTTPATLATLDDIPDIKNIEDGTGTGSVSQKDAVYDGTAIVFDDGTNGTQPGDNVPGPEVTGFQSVAFGGLRYDYINEEENNFDRTPTSVDGSQSMAVGGSVHVNGDWSFAAGKDNETYQKLAFAAGGGNRVGQTEEEFNALWNWHLNENGQPVDSDNKTYENSNSLSAVFGETNRVTRRAGFAAGSTNKVERDYSAAFGRNNEITAAGGTTQFVCGYYNLNNADDILEVGNGTASNRSNAFYVTTEGKAYVFKTTETTDVDNVLTTKGFTETRYLIKPAGTVNNDSIMYQNSSGSNQWKAISDTAFWSNDSNTPKAWSAMMRNGAGKSEVATATLQDSKYTIANKEYVDNTISNLNIENGTGTNAIQMKQDGDSGVFSFTGKNPNATEIDKTLTGDIAYGATGNFATVLGGKAAAMGKRSMAQGTTTIAKGNYSHAEGDNSVALGGDSHAEGYATVASGTASHSEGTSTQATNEAAHAEGAYTIASGLGSHAEGNYSQATGVHSHAEGNGTLASGPYAHTNGSKTIAGYQDQFVVGRFNNNKADTLFEVGFGNTENDRKNALSVHRDGHAEVFYVPMDNNNAIPNIGTLSFVAEHIDQKIDKVESLIPTNISNGNPGQAGTNKNIQCGKDSIADYDGDIVFGTGLRNTIENQAVFGKYNDNSNWENNRPLLMVGNGESDSERKNAFEVYLDGHAEVQTMGSTANSVATKAYVDEKTDLNIENGTGTGSVLQKDKTTFVFENPNSGRNNQTITVDATGEYATSLGGSARAEGKRSLASGTSTIAEGAYSHAEGNKTITTASNAHAEGLQTVASNTAAHAEGYQTIASGEYSHAEGVSTQATKVGSHAEGNGTKAINDYAHAEGNNTEALGAYAHAEGHYTYAAGWASHTEGVKTIAGYTGQTVVGQYNDNKENTLFEVGCGTSDTERKNAVEVYTDGSAKFNEIVFYTNPIDAFHGCIKESSNMVLDISDMTVNIKGTVKSVLGDSDNTHLPSYIEIDRNILPGARTNSIAIIDTAISSQGGANSVTYILPTQDKTNGSTYTLATEDYVDDSISNIGSGLYEHIIRFEFHQTTYDDCWTDEGLELHYISTDKDAFTDIGMLQGPLGYDYYRQFKPICIQTIGVGDEVTKNVTKVEGAQGVTIYYEDGTTTNMDIYSYRISSHIVTEL